MIQPDKNRLGRIHIEDKRDKMFLMSSIIPKELPGINYKYWWPSGWWGDQGEYPHCVGYSWTHWLASGHITQKRSRKLDPLGRPFDPVYLYTEAQKVDDWLGEDYDGTSVRAGAKVLKSNGFITSYNWAWDIESIKIALLSAGPVVVGTYWTYDMFFPNEDGIIKSTGEIMGGHAYLLDGINIDKQLVRIKNSWGRNWGKNGFAYISFSDLDGLIKEDGEACLPIEEEKIKE